MTIKLSLSKAVIFDAVKSATYMRGKMLKATSSNAEAAAYDLTAGDEDVDTRALNRYIQDGFEQLKTVFVDYIDNDAVTVGNNLIQDGVDGSTLTYYLKVSYRWNGTLTDACARLSSKYIADYATLLWYGDNGLSDMVNYYTAMLKNDEVAVRKCFIKSPPVAPISSYPTSVSLLDDATGDEILPNGSVTLEQGETGGVNYVLDDGMVDDIEAHSEDPEIVAVRRSKKGFKLIAGLKGRTLITIFSRHNDDVSTSFYVTVMANT